MEKHLEKHVHSIAIESYSCFRSIGTNENQLEMIDVDKEISPCSAKQVLEQRD